MKYLKQLLFLTLIFSLIIFNNCGTDTAENYRLRGDDKLRLKDYNGAIADYNKVIELAPNHSNVYYYRGNIKEFIGDLNGACSDWGKAAELGSADAIKEVANQCN